MILNTFQAGLLGFLVLVSGALQTAHGDNWVVSGNLSAEATYFSDPGRRSGLSQSNAGFSAQPEFYLERSEVRDSFLFSPFVRLDQRDSDRSHGDIRQLKWQKEADDWELVLGVDTVFWGVTETIHLVNIINQVDQVESVGQEDMLGQPMANLTLVRDWGTVDVFLLPYFRERTFPGRKGRPGSGFQVSNDEAVYESAAEQRHTDLAVRWSHSLNEWDVGLSHFSGTSREPRFSITHTQLNRHGELEWIPIYDQINQSGIDIQGTFEPWLIKLEAIRRTGQDKPFWASAAGVEYSFYDLKGSGIDLGIVAEYLYDERDESIADNDLALGLRLTFNDINSTEFLAAWVKDIDRHSRSYFVEASRRLGNDYKLSLELRGVSNVDERDPVVVLKDDNLFRIELTRYF